MTIYKDLFKIFVSVYNIFFILLFTYDKLNRIVNNSKRLSELQDKLEKRLRGKK